MNKEKNNQEQKPLTKWYILSLATEVGLLIVLPLIVFLLLGRWLDERAGTYIIFTLLGILVALGFSIYGIYLKIKKVNQ